MRAAPAFQVSLHRFGIWRSAVMLLAVLEVATIVVWSITRDTPIDWVCSVAIALSALALVASYTAFVQTPSADLRWDGRAWHFGASTGDPVPGDVSVAIDLGPWMLLRFVPASADARPRVTWLPVQRLGLAAQWHSLRCAVYSPRPAPTEDVPVGL